MKKLLIMMCVLSAFVSQAKTFNLTLQEWSFKLDKKNELNVEKALTLSANNWQPIKLGEYWQNQGFPNPAGHKRPIIGWYRCKFSLPKELQHEKLALRIGAIDDLDQTYLNGQLIGQTDKNTRHYWAAKRVYSMPEKLFNKNKANTLLIRVEDLRGNGGITTGPFEIITEKDIPRVVEKNNPLNFRMAILEFSVKYANAAAAKSAKLEKMPLPFGKKWAFTMRWDDNSKKNFRMQKLMAKYGFKGAFYLYSNYRFSPKGMNYGAPAAKQLCENGNVIGGHTMTHPQMSKLPRNEMFYEAAAIKVEREKDSNKPIAAFAFAGGNFRSKTDSLAWPDIGKILMRCGYHHNCYSVFVSPDQGMSLKAISTVNNLVPGDKKADPIKFDKQLNAILGNKKRQKINPNITWGIHVWLDEEGWQNTEALMKKYQGRREWWYCNPNEYAAYRYLYHHSKLEKIAVDGAICRYRLTYPWNADLGADVPLCFKLENAKSCDSGNGLVKLVDGDIIEAHQSKKHCIPTLIDACGNTENKPCSSAVESVKFPGLKAWLKFDNQNEKLTLTIKNNTGKSLANICLKSWLPLEYKNNEKWINLGTLKAQHEITHTIPLTVERKSIEYTNGKAYFVAQLDFLYNNKPARIYATSRAGFLPANHDSNNQK